MIEWTPGSWQSCTATQLPDYPDADALAATVSKMSTLPPLVTSWEIESLRERLAAAARGEAFLLQGGDCAESFDDCDVDQITAKLKILFNMSMVLVHASRKPVIRVGRIAGQYAKPRSTDREERDGVDLPSYRGDLVNRVAFTREDRVPDPTLLIRGYERAALTLNFIRALADGGFADLHHPEYWNLRFVDDPALKEKYQGLVQRISDSVGFMEALLGREPDALKRIDFFTSHEGLSLWYEQAQTREVPRRQGWYNLSTHFPWIGLRTGILDSAHVEYFRGIRNPIAMKVGPETTPDDLLRLLDVLDPVCEPGRMTLIHRMGADIVETALPPLIEAVQAEGRQPLWVSDPMHGNTEVVKGGRKTRRFDRILLELERSFEVHKSVGSSLGGVHFELTGEHVTECIGGGRGLSEADLEHAYRSLVDPRLNDEQALEMTLAITSHLAPGA
ncbi:3-deoxy-7-phosphoheptulonate synthase class II [bacterium]|nr:MAG: 3-deoxy-7-phosphoheptulonate synthase class II [bacterium]